MSFTELSLNPIMPSNYNTEKRPPEKAFFFFATNTFSYFLTINLKIRKKIMTKIRVDRNDLLTEKVPILNDITDIQTIL